MPRFLAPLGQSRTYLATFDFLLDLPFAVLWFTVFTTATTLGFSLLITLVGLPILTVTMLCARGAGTVERWRVRTFLGAEIEEPSRRGPRKDTLFAKLLAPLRDASTYRDLLYVWIVQPVLGLVNFVVAVTRLGDSALGRHAADLRGHLAGSGA
jgi:hypothetical protein